ncbi:MAG: MBL fold metallo-hydrolase [bacterium]
MKRSAAFLKIILPPLLAFAIAAAHAHGAAAKGGKGVRFTYFGHACFLIESLSSGATIFIDPFSGLDYPPPKAEPDVLLITHEHFDHNNAAAAKGDPVVLRGLTEDGGDWNDVSRKIRGVKIISVPTYHDEEQGKKRGKNTVFRIEMDGVVIVHAGDVGHVLSEKQAQRLKPVDVLLAPVGGYYTVEPAGAHEIAARLGPKIVIPMHYQTKYTRDLPIKPLKNFIAGRKNVEEIAGSVFTVTASGLPEEMKIVTLEPR